MEYKCEKCGATFRDPDALEKHKAVHEIKARDISTTNAHEEKDKEQPTAQRGGLPRPSSPTPSPQPSPTPRPVE